MNFNINEIKEAIKNGRTTIGIELGSTRIKAVMVDDKNNVIASGGYGWENSLVDGYWTYDFDEVWKGIQASYKELSSYVQKTYGVSVTTTGAIGFSAMMHGYLVLDSKGELLVPFRTWRNNKQAEASEKLTALFNYPIPQRWSVAHLFQAMLNGEKHIDSIACLTTLSSYVHWKLTGKKVVGIGEASGMFPIDLNTSDFNRTMVDKFRNVATSMGHDIDISSIFPEVLVAGEEAGMLSDSGALLIDPSGNLRSGIPLCPPEGDAGTGMVATNTITPRTGSVSAGTSVFALIVLENDLNEVHPEIDQVTTPNGKLVAMAHSNNCTSNLNLWVNLFAESLSSYGVDVDMNKLYETLYTKALEGDGDGGGLLSYGYLSGEHMTHFEEGRPLFVCSADSQFNLANFMRVNLYTALGALKIGLDILLKEENVVIDKMLGHGGLFKTKGVGQRFMAAAINAPVTVMETAGEGGAWGIALLASYMVNKYDGESLDAYLNDKVFINESGMIMEPVEEDVIGFEKFMERYKTGLPIERAAVEHLK